MISQWLVVISECTGNVDSGAELVQVKLDACRPSGSAASSEGRQTPGCMQGPLRSHLVRFLIQANPDILPIAWSTIPHTQFRYL